VTDVAKACPGARQKTIHLLRQLADTVDEEKLRNEVTKSRLGRDKSGVMKSRIADIKMSKESTKC
jgi:hypothetical protein